MFVLANYKLTDNVEAYLQDVRTTRPSSSSLIAPYPFDSHGNGVIDLGRQHLQPVRRRFRTGHERNLLERLTGVGQRISTVTTR